MFSSFSDKSGWGGRDSTRCLLGLGTVRSHGQDRTETRFAAVHLFVGFRDAVERIFLNHRVHAAQRAEFQCVLRIRGGEGSASEFAALLPRS